MRKKLLLLFVVALIIIIGYVIWHRDKAAAPSEKKSATTTSSPAPQGTFDKTKYSVSDPSSLWVVVNKQRPLNPKNYTPDVVVPNVPLRLSAANGEMHVSKQMAPALEKMFANAASAGAPMMVASAYRSYSLQVSVYGNEVKNFGQAKADSESARPGFSEHQTGLAVDIEPTNRTCEVEDCFGQTPQGKWLDTNAYKYGFIHRYAPDKVTITGYRAEAWHFRYVGTELSTEMHNQHIETLEEFFNLGAAPDYKN